MKSALLLMALASPAWADCGGYEHTFLTCQIENSTKALSVCFDEETASYRFGPKTGAPDLEIMTPIAMLKHSPWPGAGRTIWEEVQFFNQGHSYMVTAALERTFPDEADGMIKEQLFGGVLVHRGAKEVADLSCDPASIILDDASGLSWAKNQLGYVWDNAGQEWLELPD